MESIKGRYVLGMMDGTGNGKHNCEAAFTYELDGDGRFSMSAEVWNPLRTDLLQGGQCVNQVLEAFPDDAQAAAMAAVWQRWHLNDMQAGCEHQRAAGWGKGRTIALSPSDMTEVQRQALSVVEVNRVEPLRKAHRAVTWADIRDKDQWAIRHTVDICRPVEGLLIDDTHARTTHVEALQAVAKTELKGPRADGHARIFINRDEKDMARLAVPYVERLAAEAHPMLAFEGAIYTDSLGAPCPECGYRYGTKWLKEEVPANVIEAIQAWPDFVTPERDDGEDTSLAGVLARLGVVMDAQTVAVNPRAGDWGERADVTHWTCSFALPDGQGWATFYSMRSAHYGRKPEAAEVLGCALRDDPRGEDFEEWASNLGFDTDSREALRLFHVCEDQAQALRIFLGADVYEELSDAS